MLIEDTQLTIFEELEDVPECRTKHDFPGVRKWAGECSIEIAALLSYCEGEGWICKNTLTGMATLDHTMPCKGCNHPISECWKVYPL